MDGRENGRSRRAKLKGTQKQIRQYRFPGDKLTVGLEVDSSNRHAALIWERIA